MRSKKLLLANALIFTCLIGLITTLIFISRSVDFDLNNYSSFSVNKLNTHLYNPKQLNRNNLSKNRSNNVFKHAVITLGNRANLYVYNLRSNRLICAKNLSSREKAHLNSPLQFNTGNQVYSKKPIQKLSKISDAYYISSYNVSSKLALYLLENSEPYLSAEYANDEDDPASFRGTKYADTHLVRANSDFIYGFDLLNLKRNKTNLTKYDQDSILIRHEWHPTTFMQTKSVSRLDPVIYFSNNDKRYYLPLTKVDHNWYFEIDNQNDTNYRYFVKASDAIFINNHPLIVDNVPMIIDHDLTKDPYNYALHYANLSHLKNKLYPAGQVIDELSKNLRIKCDPNTALSIKNVASYIDNADNDGSISNTKLQKSVQADLKTRKTITAPIEFNKAILSDYENSHLLYRSFGYTLLDPKPYDYDSRDNWYYEGVESDDVIHDSVKNKEAYIKIGLFKNQPLNGKNGLHHGLYVLFDNIDSNNQVVYPKYPVGKQIYVQSIVRNSLPNRSNEYYFIARYNEKVKGGYRQWIYPVLPDKNVRISSIVNHKQIAMHYNNFMDTAILGYHLLDHDRYHEFDNKYELKKYIYNKCLPSIDTASENLAQEQN